MPLLNPASVSNTDHAVISDVRPPDNSSTALRKWNS
jgi:hypothetical protein